ncbi:TPA: hypothetical protein ACNVDX_002746 [Citrobacter gillenii]
MEITRIVEINKRLVDGINTHVSVVVLLLFHRLKEPLLVYSGLY